MLDLSRRVLDLFWLGEGVGSYFYKVLDFSWRGCWIIRGEGVEFFLACKGCWIFLGLETVLDLSWIGEGVGSFLERMLVLLGGRVLELFGEGVGSFVDRVLGLSVSL